MSLANGSPPKRGFLARSPLSEMPSRELPGDSRDADLFGQVPVVKPSAEKTDQRPNLNGNQ